MDDPKQRSVGRYRLEALVGKGGMAEVYRATDTTLGRTVAVKMVLPSFVSDPTFLERFLREARLVASLDHPNILPIYDFGDQEGVPYLVMPYVDGGSLSRRIGVSGSPAGAAAQWIPQLADALDTAHAADILHRDVKPSNVLLDRGDRPILSDFGIARHAGATSSLTTTGALLGTPAYMAPELAQGGSASAATDRYALAILAYEMLAGRPPFDGETPLAVLHQHVRRAAPAITTLAPSLPRELDEVFARALSKRPEERPRTCVEFAEEITTILACVEEMDSDSTVRARWSPASGTRETSPPRRATPPAPLPALESSPRRGSWLVAGIGLVALVGIGAIARTAFQKSNPDAGATAPQEIVRQESTSTAPPPSIAEPRIEPAPASVPTPAPDHVAVAGPDRPRPALDAAATDALIKKIARHLRRPVRLSQAELLDLATALDSKTGSELHAPLRPFAKGGVAYAKGDDKAARVAIDEIRASASRANLPASFQTWLPTEALSTSGVRDWELAAFYGDVRSEGLKLVEAHLAQQPNDLRARYGRAVLLHIEGEHRNALEDMKPLCEKAAGTGGEMAGLVLQFTADEMAEVGEWKDAVATYRRAAQLGGKIAASAGFEGGQIALEHLGDRAAATELFETSCKAGQPLACRRTASFGRLEPKRLPQRRPR